MSTSNLSEGADRSLDEVAVLLGVKPEELVGGLDLVQAARVLGIAPSTLRQRALAGQIAYQRDGRSWRFFWWHLASYLAQREHPAADAGQPRPVVTHAGARVGAEGQVRSAAGLKSCFEEEAVRLALL